MLSGENCGTSETGRGYLRLMDGGRMLRLLFEEGRGRVEKEDRSELGPSEGMRLGGDDDDGVSRKGLV